MTKTLEIISLASEHELYLARYVNGRMDRLYNSLTPATAALLLLGRNQANRRAIEWDDDAARARAVARRDQDWSRFAVVANIE